MKRDERKNLSNLVKERRDFIEQAIDFAEELLEKKGVQTFSEIHGSYTHTKRVAEFGNFQIKENDGYNMYGAGHIQINLIPIGGIGGIRQPLTVLQVSYYGHFNINELGEQMGSTIDVFNDQDSWQKLLREHLDKKDEIMAADERKARLNNKHSKTRKIIAAAEDSLTRQADLLLVR